MTLTLPEARAEAEDGALDRRFSRRMALASVSMAAEISDAGLRPKNKSTNSFLDEPIQTELIPENENGRSHLPGIVYIKVTLFMTVFYHYRIYKI